jgi:hypothetical protein
MTSSSRDALICECGHTGSLRCRENDQPFSGLWEAYSLEGFSGGTLTITNYADLPKDLLATLQPTCPKCGQNRKGQIL